MAPRHTIQDGYTALMFACNVLPDGYIDIVKVLVAAKAELNAKNLIVSDERGVEEGGIAYR